MSWLDKHIHLMGVGGAGMSALARLLYARRVRVSGDDRADSPALRALQAEGIPVVVGHDPRHLEGVDILVPSSAIAKDEPELVEARRRGIPVWHRGDLIGALMQDNVGIAVAGTHGKSTTAGMIATILTDAGLAPSFVIGATPQPLGVNARWGVGEAFVVEADEYDHTFLHFQPRVAVVTNVEYDHPDTFADLNATLDAFAMFVRSVPKDGVVITCADDAGCVAMLKRAGVSAPVVDYGIQGGLWRASNLRANPLGGVDFSFTGAGIRGEVSGACSLRVPGEHNVLNALAALVAADACGVPMGEAVKSLGGYRGAGRRFELKGEARGVRIFDDYAHHPTEIKATLRGARQRYPLGNIWAIWQPHTYSRTAALLDAFAEAFDDADHVIVLPIYAARERQEDFGFIANALNPIEIARKIRHRDARNAASFGDALGMLLSQVKGGDVVITLSAGDGNQVGERLLEMLRR
ncbi:MAG: UDP-N-acetylmuramate--L-alanine ligase [Chloroflexi bacterium]|jgi:UDP-N-acetylmuramate--alanine ligase|uniref:UDP-N-acetylmuramate--L-alanine ligase n=1 Tax=Candidatus Thermofonsia Clade 3 bacterium TaxID=2364212 RepID=A0A2M8QDE7_9CHLR|nr:UDP-N-acetylmuramate--L-alanine ligase [Candidatus Roseilinea sp. NK_OTU-006]PJF47836.1 MAG: UDP-N-acetylmuramate--L-alanine ligase [Candidatus Thermofonsia Clade 3 bacterium]RMG63574.1 MAG: UDP-N-acetylmuramate--L-alanine ligase [Chloroflexota bacterium]